MPEFSIIIPCYRDEKKLRNLLLQLQGMQDFAHEIIVVDGASSVVCRNISNFYDAHWLPSRPCRGRQLSAGAALAQGAVLWFLHADTRLSKNAFAAIRHVIDKGAVGGFFKFRFDVPRKWPAIILEPAIALRCRFGVPYGDQGFFMRRESYHAAGGHAPWPLFEEVPLVHGARRLGKFVALSEPIFVDSRRWRRDGWWRRTWYNRKLALKFACGVTPDVLAARYHSKQVLAKQPHMKQY
ncbi:transferase 2, rSAM/selenodomain-associated [Nitrosomonas sp. Nm51]|uniref:TIGR04283 family arsenosugar biosynthesis glycosyltransferase n=1 Tax=Nitrosomonas sp. Nm51 TaxID=133720 RepID=UPI0008BD9073|nr:TIGR04283 family arsenosugar biosynthesis glycosyltransferase [Nitrosomonas sp. Nm51]SER59087.1 transferase 2, rSAM/selenodomain-associated [Nitrosomonas sp. Nm51]